jgi:hypothetical protein
MAGAAAQAAAMTAQEAVRIAWFIFPPAADAFGRLFLNIAVFSRRGGNACRNRLCGTS